MSNTHISTHLQSDSEISTEVNTQGENRTHVVNLYIDGLKLSLFDHVDRGHGIELANALVSAGEQLRAIYRAREVAEYDQLRTEEEWEWAARDAAMARLMDESVEAV